MDIIDFINKNSDWYEILQLPPYFIDIQKQNNFYHFCAPAYSEYNDIDGIVVCDVAGTFVTTCLPATKRPSGKAERLAESRYTRFVDGFWIYLWNEEGRWHLSTIGSLNAYDIKVENTNIGKLVEKAVGSINELTENLSPIYTYIFQLTAPQIQFAIDYGRDPHLWYFCRRHVETGELDFTIPQLPSLCNIVERLEAPLEKENYIEWNIDEKIYIEHPNHALLEMRKLRSNYILDTDRVIRMWQNNSIDEFITKVGLTNFITPIADKLEALVIEVKDIYARLLKENGEDKTAFITAAYKYQTYASSAMIHFYNRECSSIRNFYRSIDSKYLVPIIGDTHYGIRKRA